MKYKVRRTGPSAIVRIATRGGVIASAAAIAALGVAALAPGTANAAPAAVTPLPLQVTFSQHGGGEGGALAAFNAQGDITLSAGYVDGNYAQATVDLDQAGTAVPSAPPSFTTDTSAGDSPSWVLVLSNGNSITGYPAQLGNGATADFTGPQWQVGTDQNFSDSNYETYQQALDDAGDANGNLQVTQAYIWVDGYNQLATTDTLTDVTYDGAVLGYKAAVIVYPPADQSVPAGVPVDLKPTAATDTSDNAFTWTAAGLPAGLSINSATGEITGTPTTAGTYTITLTATGPYNDPGTNPDNASAGFTLTVAPASTYTAVGGTNGKIKNAHSGKYLNVAANTYAGGADLIQWDSSGASHETFQYVTIENSADKVVGGYLQAESPDGTWYYVTASGEGQLTLGSEVEHPSSSVLASVLGSSEDVTRSGSYYTFVNDGGYVADDSGWSTANGAPVIAYPSTGGTNQEWTMP